MCLKGQFSPNQKYIFKVKLSPINNNKALFAIEYESNLHVKA